MIRIPLSPKQHAFLASMQANAQTAQAQFNGAVEVLCADVPPGARFTALEADALVLEGPPAPALVPDPPTG